MSPHWSENPHTMTVLDKDSQPQVEPAVMVELAVDATITTSTQISNGMFIISKDMFLQMLTKFHAGYFRISLSLCSQALLWKILSEPSDDVHVFRRVLSMLPSTAFILIWCIAFFTILSLSVVYILHCFIHFDMMKSEFLNNVGVNYLFAPWISWLLLLQSTPFFTQNSTCYVLLWWIFTVPIVILDIKIYGQWFTKGKRMLSYVANPTSQLSVIGNLVGARGAAGMGWEETATCMFTLGMVHYLVLFVTLYQRLPGSNSLRVTLRPVFFLFLAAPSMASLAWDSIAGSFDTSSKLLFFLSLFLFASLVSRPALFKKSMRKFNLAWWAFSFPSTAMAIASIKYAQAVKSHTAHVLMLLLSALSVLVSLVLMVFTALNTNSLAPDEKSRKTQSSDCHKQQKCIDIA